MSETSTRLSRALQGTAAASVVCSVLLPLLALLAGCGGSDSTASADGWQRAAAAAITPMAQRVPVMAEQASEWEQGTLDPTQYRPELATTLAVMARARDQVSKLPPYPGQPMVDRLYLASMNLYVASVQADEASLDVGQIDLRQQLGLLAQRVRELGDRIFDQGRLLTGQSLVPTGLSGAKVELPSEVPDWNSEGLAAGPPLAPAPAASVVWPAPAVSAPSAVRLRLSELIKDESLLAQRAAGLAGAAKGPGLQELAAELVTAAQMAR